MRTSPSRLLSQSCSYIFSASAGVPARSATAGLPTVGGRHRRTPQIALCFVAGPHSDSGLQSGGWKVERSHGYLVEHVRLPGQLQDQVLRQQYALSQKFSLRESQPTPSAEQITFV